MTQGWGYPPTGDGGDEDATRSFAPVTPATPEAQAPQYQPNPFQATGPQWAPQGPPPSRGGGPGQGGGGGNGLKIALVVAVVLLVIALGVLLATQWNNLVGGDDDDAAAPVTSTVTVPPGDGDISDSAPQTSGSRARPTSPSLPGGVTPVNDAAMTGAPTGNFNSIWLSGPTTPGFAENVRNAYVDAYRVDRETDQTVVAASPTTGLTYTMTCVDKGSYIHCTGGNDANVYIA